MAYTTPTVRATGDNLSAANWNTDVVNNLIAINAAPFGLSGYVNGAGSIARGTGFTITKGGTGIYTINFTTPFTAVPVVLVTVATSGFTTLTTPATGSCVVNLVNPAGTAADQDFIFLAVPVS